MYRKKKTIKAYTEFRMFNGEPIRTNIVCILSQNNVNL